MAVHEIILLNQNTPVNIPSGLVPKGAYAAGTDYAVGDSVDYLGSSYVMFVDAAAGTVPTDTTKWQVMANKGDTGAAGADGADGTDGADGASSYTYIAYASADDGTDFTTTFDAALNYIAILTSATEIVAPAVGDFVGLWKNYKGATGAAGSDGTNGTDGEDAFVYIAYASAADGTDFTLTFDADLDYIAILNTTTAIASPLVADFAGLWKNYKGATGATGPAGTSGHTIQEEGSSLTARTNLNFVGAGVTATDDAGNDATLVTIPTYTLPTAAAATLGGIKVGDRLSIASGVLSADVQTTVITGKASLALDNLASVAINTSLISDTDSTDDLGSLAKKWANIYGDAIHAPTGRCATFTIAANDSTAAAKAQADYICDGTSDEVQINTALAAVPATGGKVMLLAGNYSIAAPIVIDQAGINLCGEGSKATLVTLANGSNCDMVTVNTASESLAYLLINDIQFNGNAAGQAAGTHRGFYQNAGAGWVYDIHMHNVEFFYMKGNGIEVNTQWGMILDSITIEYCGGHGVVINGGADGKIVHSKIISNTGSAIYVSSSVTTATYTKILNNHLDAGVSNYGIYLNGSLCVIKGNTIPDSANLNHEGIRVVGDNNLVDGNTIVVDDATKMLYGIHLISGADKNIVSNNFVYSDTNNRIKDDGAYNLIVETKTTAGTTPDFKIKGNLWFTGDTFAESNKAIGFYTWDDPNEIYEGLVASSYNDPPCVGMFVNSNSHNFLLSSWGNKAKNHDHLVQTNPTMFVHSATDPDTANTQWLSLTHNQTNGVLAVGTGAIQVNNNVLLSENTSLQLDTLLSDDEKYCGITELGTMGYSATVGDLVYLDGVTGNNKWELAKADAVATSGMKLGLVCATTAEDATCQVLLYGKMRSAAFPAAFTVGAPVYVSAATAGDVVVAAPTGTTNFVVRIIGYGNTAEDLFFCPDNNYLELA
jgi:hypothetical protein